MLEKKGGAFSGEKVIAEFERLTRDAANVQRETLRRILAENGAAEYLQGLGLAGRTDPGSFRACVPLATHADFERSMPCHGDCNWAVLPLTKHRWCKWHVLRKAKENLGPVYAKNAGFRDELHKICHHMLTIDEFESAWGELIGKYALQDHPFFDPDIRCPPEMGETILLRSILR